MSGDRDSDALSLNPVSNWHPVNEETMALTEVKWTISKTQTMTPMPHWPRFVPILGLFFFFFFNSDSSSGQKCSSTQKGNGPKEHFSLSVSSYCVDNKDMFLVASRSYKNVNKSQKTLVVILLPPPSLCDLGKIAEVYPSLWIVFKWFQ